MNRIILVALPLLASFAISAGAQVPLACDRDKTVQECLNKLFDSPVGTEIHKEVTTELVADATNKQTAASITGNDGVVRNFLPQILGGLGFQHINQTEAGLAFEKPIHFLGNRNIKVSLSGIIARGEVFKDALDKIPESIRKDRKTTLEGEVGDFDQTDLKISFNYEPNSTSAETRWGRDPEDYTDVVEELDVELLDRSVVDALSREVLPLVDQRAREKGLLPDADTVLGDLYDKDELADVLKTWQAAVKKTKESLKAAGAAQTDLYEYLGLLISAQPQLFLEHEQFLRSELTGPEKRTSRLTFECGVRNNLNNFVRWAKVNQQAGCAVDQKYRPNLACLRAYRNLKEDALERGWRISLTAQYDEFDDYLFSLPADNVELSLPARETWKAKAGIGRRFANFSLLGIVGGNSAEENATIHERPARIDLTAEYEFDSIDEAKKRLVATLTLSQPMFDNTVASLTLVYANRPEFLGDVDEKLGARFGFTIKRDKPAN